MLTVPGREHKLAPEESMTHRTTLFTALALGVASLATAPAAFAQADFAQKKNCMACHSVEKKVLGPAFKDVAAKYAGQKDAVAMLTNKVLKGGAGVWGNIPMPANSQVSDAEAKQLVEWILTLK
jgi:cytochrome c